MPDDRWEQVHKLLGDDFFGRVPTEEEVRTAFEAEMEACHDQGRPFSPLAFLAGVPGTDLHQIRPGVYRGYSSRFGVDRHGGWSSGSC